MTVVVKGKWGKLDSRCLGYGEEKWGVKQVVQNFEMAGAMTVMQVLERWIPEGAQQVKVRAFFLGCEGRGGFYDFLRISAVIWVFITKDCSVGVMAGFFLGPWNSC